MEQIAKEYLEKSATRYKKHYDGKNYNNNYKQQLLWYINLGFSTINESFLVWGNL